jgi:hypothetical protein
MEKQDYSVWWPLHLRRAKGETLSADEQALYEAGVQQLDAEEAETFRRDEELDQLREIRRRVLFADAEHQRLSQQYEKMRAEMTRLEALLDERTRQALGIGN